MSNDIHPAHPTNHHGHGYGSFGPAIPSTIPEGQVDDDKILKPLMHSKSFLNKVAIASGHVLNDLVGSLWFSYLLLYLQNIVKISSASAGYLLLLGQFADAIATPVIGFEANKPLYLCKKLGRCKSWHLLGLILVAIPFPFIFLKCLGCEDATDTAKMVYYAPFFVLCQVGWASTQISHLALIPKMSPDELVRTELIALRYAFTVAANVTVFALAYFFLGFSETLTPDDSFKFTEITLWAVGIGLVIGLIFHLTVKEEPDKVVKRSVAFLNSLPSMDTRRQSISESIHCSTRTLNPAFNYRRRRSTFGKYSEEARQALLHRNSIAPSLVNDAEISFHLESGRHYESMASGGQNHGNSVLGQIQHSLQVINQSVQTLRPTNPLSTTWLSLGKEKMETTDWLKMSQFYVVGFIYMCTRLCVNVTQVYVPLYLQKSLKLSVKTLSLVPLTMYLAGFVLSCFLKGMNKYVGRQLSFIFGALLCIIGSLLITCVDWEADPAMKEYGIYGVAILLGSGGSAMLVTSLSITADLIGTNVESGSFVYGTMSFTDKLSCGIVISFINFVAPCQIDNGDCDDSVVVPFYRTALASVCGGTALASIFGVILLTVKIYISNRHRF